MSVMGVCVEEQALIAVLCRKKHFNFQNKIIYKVLKRVQHQMCNKENPTRREVRILYQNELIKTKIISF